MRGLRLQFSGGKNINWSAVIPLGASLLLASACDTNKQPLTPDFSNSVHNNMFVHITKPRVSDPNAAASDMEGARALRSIDRYHRGETEELKEESTTTQGSGTK